MRFPIYEDLSKEQLEVVNLELSGRHLVTGPPGTGKTVLAVYRAQSLAAKGLKPLILTYSRVLTDYTGTAVRQEKIDAQLQTYFSWLYRHFCVKARVRKVPELKKYFPDWEAILSRIDWEPSEDVALIVDEAQDMPGQAFIYFRAAARSLTVFADENQRIKDINSSIKDIRNAALPDEEREVTRNYRNTVEIAQLAAEFYAGARTGIPDLPERSNRKPPLIHTESKFEAMRRIRLIEANNRNRTIGVLIEKKNLLKEFLGGFQNSFKVKNPVRFYLAEQDEVLLDFDDPGIKLVTYESAKGLEFDIVVIPELQLWDKDPELPPTKMRVFMLFSRARNDLILMYSGRGKPRILENIDWGLIDSGEEL